MARRTEIFTTENYAYQVTQLAADKEGRAALLRAQKLAVKAGGGLDSLVADMSPDDLDYFCDLFARYTKLINGDKKPQLLAIFSEHFSGGDGWFEMVKWLAFCLGFNFGPFFLALVKRGGEIKDAALEGVPKGESPDEELTGSDGD